jgi:hypothetical protein
MPEDLSLHQRFQAWITHRYFVRLHMALMLSVVVLSGVLASRLLHAAGVQWLVVRYPMAVAFSYLVFFGLVRLWLAYAVRVRRNRQWPNGTIDFVDDRSSGGTSIGSSGGSFNFSPGGSSHVSGGGGKFGGGGASASFDDGGGAPARMVAVPGSAPSGSSAKGSGGSFDLDDDGLIILVVFIIAVAGIFGAGLFLVLHAPVILSEAAFQAAMAAGLVKMSRDVHEEGWMESVFKATRIPFLVSLAGAIAFGGVALRYCPHGTTLSEVFQTCVFK